MYSLIDKIPRIIRSKMEYLNHYQIFKYYSVFLYLNQSNFTSLYEVNEYLCSEINSC